MPHPLSRLTLWCGEVNDVSVRLEHVDLLDRLDGLHVHLLESSLQLLVVGAGVSLHLLDLSSWGSLASVIITMSDQFSLSYKRVFRIVPLPALFRCRLREECARIGSGGGAMTYAADLAIANEQHSGIAL